MKHRFCILVVAALACFFCPRPALGELDSDIRKILQDRSVKPDKLGIEIIQLGSRSGQSRAVFQHNATTALIPASNMKLLTTAAALELLGKDYRFRTTLMIRARDIAIVGDGDPSLGDGEMLRKLGWGVDTVFKSWAQVLKDRGLSHVGRLCVDDSVFDEVFIHPSWPAEQQHKRYVAQVGGVNLNANCVDFFLRVGAFGERVQYTTDPATEYVRVENNCTFGNENAVWLARQPGTNRIILRGQTNARNINPYSVTVHDPPMYAATVFAETLQANGIRIEHEVTRDRTVRQRAAEGSATNRWNAIAVHETPLSAVLGRANKDSMNVYAEALCKRIGFATSGASGSWENGTAAIGAFLQSLGVDSSEFIIDDGSGLSKRNAVSANAIARVLAHVFAGPNRQAFIDSLSVAGADGTLEKRFRDSDLRGRVFAKSGYVAGVSALSGYLKTPDNRWFAFSILMNGVSDVAAAKQIQERILTALDRHSR